MKPHDDVPFISDEPRQPLPPMSGVRMRAVARPTLRSQKLAADLSHGDARKAMLVMRLPLFRVSIEGSDAL